MNFGLSPDISVQLKVSLSDAQQIAERKAKSKVSDPLSLEATRAVVCSFISIVTVAVLCRFFFNVVTMRTLLPAVQS